MEFFFILSGFVLTPSYGRKGKLDFKSFMQARFLRIYPLHRPYNMLENSFSGMPQRTADLKEYQND